LNWPIIYYSQLIGKDALYTAALYLLLFLYLKRNRFLIVFAGVLFTPIRVQTLLLAGLLLIYLHRTFSPGLRLAMVYIVTVIVGTYALNFSSIIGAEPELGSGVTNLIFNLNRSYLLGTLLLNPVRILQYCLQYIEFSVRALFDGRFTVDHLSIPFLIYFLFNIRHIVKAFSNFRNPVGAFFLINLMLILAQPLVNLRYFAVLIPFAALAIELEKHQREAHKLPKKKIAVNNFRGALHEASSRNPIRF
jgi:hypothetical protein